MTASIRYARPTTLFDAEAQLLAPVGNYLRRKLYSRQITESPFFEYRIDLYAYSPVKQLTVAVELKLRNWKRAFEQALLYQLCADRAFIAVPQATARCVDLCGLAAHGVGLLAVGPSGRCEQWLAAGQPEIVREHYRDHYIGLIHRGPPHA